MGLERNIAGGFGPLEGSLPSSQNLPLTVQGIGNWQAATFTGAATKVITGNGAGKQRRVKIYTPTAGVTLTWKTVDKGATPPTVTAGLAGGTDDGTIIPAGAIEEFTIRDNVDLWLAGSAAAVVQVTMWEVS